MNSQVRKYILVVVALVGLALIYLFQRLDFLSLLSVDAHPYVHFSVRKATRLVLNDSMMLMLIYAWFDDAAITRLALRLQLIDTFVLLPLYLILKLTLEGDSEISSPFLSQLHRLIVNPTLMILLIPGIYFQRLSRA